jgi:glycosyltransferase involved in cell wall biosynthesis
MDPQKGRTFVERAARVCGIPVVFSTDLKRDLLNASMFVYVTQLEGLGSAALLAMGIGVPVIASRVGGLAEVFEDGLSGLYVRNDVNEIAQAMTTLRDAGELASRLIASGKERVAQMFTKEHLVEGTLRSYENALAC